VQAWVAMCNHHKGLGKAEVVSSILTGSTTQSARTLFLSVS
jgi:hypothetical protein